MQGGYPLFSGCVATKRVTKPSFRSVANAGLICTKIVQDREALDRAAGNKGLICASAAENGVHSGCVAMIEVSVNEGVLGRS
jgi:hypothetical protein